MAGAQLRIGDAERDEAIAQLSEHFASGRLDKDELDERTDAVWTARTRGDLDVLFADLAPPRERVGPATPYRPWRRRGWFPLPFAPVLLVLLALTALTHVPFVLLAFVGCFFLVGRRQYGHRRW